MNADMTFSGRVLEVCYTTNRVLIRFEGLPPETGSIVRFSDCTAASAKLEAAVKLLEELIDIEGPQPGTADWATKVDAFLCNRSEVYGVNMKI